MLPPASSTCELPPHWLKPPPPQNAGDVQLPQSIMFPQPSAFLPHV